MNQRGKAPMGLSRPALAARSATFWIWNWCTISCVDISVKSCRSPE